MAARSQVSYPGLPDRWPMIGLTDEWHTGPPVRFGDEYMQFRARTPWIVLTLRQDAIGEHARWAYTTTLKHARFHPWRFWSIKDIGATDIRIFRLRPVDRWLGRALAYYAAWKAIVG